MNTKTDTKSSYERNNKEPEGLRAYFDGEREARPRERRRESADAASFTYDTACKEARINRLNNGLKTLASWCHSRAILRHDEQTTMTMLFRKVSDLSLAVDKAGWRAVEEWLDNN